MQYYGRLKVIIILLTFFGLPLSSCNGRTSSNNTKDEDTASEVRNVDDAPDNSPMLHDSGSRSSGPPPPVTSELVNVKSYGAKGDGKNDDTRAINSALATGKSVYIPKGEYIISSGPLIVRKKTGIRIYGDGDETWIHPPGQLERTGKTNYHSTFCIDESKDIRIENMRIESRGENWGDADGGAKMRWGNERTDWVIQKGGHAVLVTRSVNVLFSNITGRFCGSTGVFYASSSDNVTFRNCFANAASLGYGGFCADNFIDGSVDIYPKRRYYFENCRVAAEPAMYPGKTFSSKAGIIVEGDDKRILNTFINGGIISDCGTGGNAMSGGAAVYIENSNAVCRNVTGRNNYIGLKVRNRAEIGQPIQTKFENFNFTGNKVCGIYVNAISIKGGTITIINSSFQQAPASVWKFTKNPSVSETAGIVIEGFMSAKMSVDKTKFSGGERYITALDKCDLNIRNSVFEKASKSSFLIYGGGELGIEHSTIELVDAPVISNSNYNNKYKSPVKMTFRKNTLRGDNIDHDIWDVKKMNAAVKNDIDIADNTGMRAARSEAEVQANASGLSGVVESYALQGQNTSLIIKLDNAVVEKLTYIRSGAGNNYKILQVVQNWDGNKMKIKVFLENDVRRFFPFNSKIIVL